MARVRRTAFTLIEMVLTTGIILALFGMIAAAIFKSKQAAEGMYCLNNLRQLALAVHSHHEDNGHLPPYALGHSRKNEGSWWLHLLRYAGEDNFYDRYTKSVEPTDSGAGTLVVSAVIQDDVREQAFPLLQCAADPSVGLLREVSTTNYLANWYVLGDGVGGCYTSGRRFTDIVDGLSNTILFAEGYANCNGTPRQAIVACCLHNFGITWDGKPSDDPSYLPNDYTMFQIKPFILGDNGCDKWRSQTPHAAMPVAVADGTVRMVSADIDPAVWKRLLKPNDGGIFPKD